MFINPEIVLADGAATCEEGCLSVPGIFEKVERAERIRVRASDAHGQPFTLDATGLLAVCIQHEMDHLEGKVFVDYLSRLKQQRILGASRSKASGHVVGNPACQLPLPESPRNRRRMRGLAEALNVMKLMFAGTPEFAAAALDRLVNAGFEISLSADAAGSTGGPRIAPLAKRSQDACDCRA